MPPRVPATTRQPATAKKKKTTTKKKKAAAKKKTPAPKKKAPAAKKKAPAAKKKATGLYRPIRGSAATVSELAPTPWMFWPNKNQTLGIWADRELLWVGNDGGEVYSLAKDGAPQSAFRLPRRVRCLIADDAWRYAGCADGKVYDLTGRVPRAAYVIAKDVDPLWMDVCRGKLAVADDAGAVTTFDFEGERLWRAQPRGARNGWMVRCDGTGVYHGHSRGVVAYEWQDGSVRWERKTGAVGFGWQTDDTVYAATNKGVVVAFRKSDGESAGTYRCDRAFLPACAATEDGAYVFAADDAATIYCFSRDGARVWTLATNCGSAGSMQYREGMLYLVTWDGAFAAVDVSEAAITAALRGDPPKTRIIRKGPSFVQAEKAPVESTKNVGAGVLVECVRQGSKLRVRVLADGFDPTWNCQFPRDIREEGARYVVESVREAEGGGFYRAFGDIQRLET